MRLRPARLVGRPSNQIRLSISSMRKKISICKQTRWEQLVLLVLANCTYFANQDTGFYVPFYVSLPNLKDTMERMLYRNTVSKLVISSKWRV